MISEVHQSEAGSWLRDASGKIAELAELPENWDSYGSRPIQRKACQRAVSLLKYLSESEMPAPQIFPVPGGGIQFEWRNERRELELEFPPDGSIEYLIVDEEGEMREGVVAPDSFVEIDWLVNWFTSQPSSVALV